jgi:Transposase IS66 family
MILFEKFGKHQLLNRQSERYVREGMDLSLSTLADQVAACALALRPLYALIETHVLAAERLHGDDHGSDPGEGEDRSWPRLDLRPRRQAVRRQGPAGGALPASRLDQANIQSGISRASSASCRPTLTAATIGSTARIDDLCRFPRRFDPGFPLRTDPG